MNDKELSPDKREKPDEKTIQKYKKWGNVAALITAFSSTYLGYSMLFQDPHNVKDEKEKRAPINKPSENDAQKIINTEPDDKPIENQEPWSPLRPL